jgi:hypothetical protein
VGQKVKINIKTLSRLKEVLVMYLLPIVGYDGAVLGRSYLRHISGDKPDVPLQPEGFSVLISLLTARVFPGKWRKSRNRNSSSNR